MRSAALFFAAGLVVGASVAVNMASAEDNARPDYITRQPDTWASVAAAKNVTVLALQTANCDATGNGSLPSACTGTLRWGRQIHVPPATVTPTTTSTTSTTQPPTTTTAGSSTTTSTTAAPTTTLAPTTTGAPSPGLAFAESFSSPLDPARFTAAYWRTQEDTESDPALNGSKILVEDGQLRIETGEQNYGDAAVRINQPFDWAGRTGTISLDVSLAAKDGWTRIDVAEDPYPLTMYNDDNSAGEGPNRGFDLQFGTFAGCIGAGLRTYEGRTETNHDGQQFPQPCVPGVATPLTHMTIEVSNTSVVVRAANDQGGMTVIGSWSGLNLGFTRGYVYLDSHNHATIKYALQPTWITHWDNVTFDGPVLPTLGVATASTYHGGTVPGVPADVTGTRLALNAQHGQQDHSVTLRYSLNGHTQHLVPLVRDLNVQTGTYTESFPIDATELVAGTNQVVFTWTGTSGIPPMVANIQLQWQGTSSDSTTTAPTTSPATSTSTAPATTTTSTAPSTSGPTTSQAPTSTSAPTSSTSTTVAPAPGTFFEDFSQTSAFTARFDHGWSGEVAAGALSGGINANDWPADHDMSCGDPNTTHRSIHVTPGPEEPGFAGSGTVRNVEQAFYPCLPGGDPTKGHVMTSVNTEGYVIAWFSPKQMFSNTKRVCWDQNLTMLGGGKWTQVVFLTEAEIGSNSSDLGFTSPDFPSTGVSSPRGESKFGVKVFIGGMSAWQNGGALTGFGGANTNDKAARYQHCVTDLENGNLDITIAQPDGSTLHHQLAGQIPNGPIRVVFEDDNYNPDKHFDQQGRPRNSTGLYTWHWDNILVETR